MVRASFGSYTLRLPVLLFALLALTALLAGPADAATQLLRVYPADKADYMRLLSLAPEATDEGVVAGEGYVEFAAEEARRVALLTHRFRVETRINDLESYYASRLESGARVDFGAYHTYTEAIAAMDALVAAHPALITAKQSIGTTIEGRPIWIYKISDNPNVDEDEPEIFFNAYIHAREPISFEVLYDLAQYLLNGYGTDPRATTLVDTRETWILPVVNPDGVEYNRQTNPNGGGMWRKNRRNNGGSYGVDLNRNFGYNWGYDNEGSSPYGGDETYRGTGPFSEPETAAMRDFVVSRHFKLALNYHAYGGLHNFAPGHNNVHNGDYDECLELGRIRRATSGYNTGTSWELLYLVNGDANDWMQQDEVLKPKIYAFVSEVGTDTDGFWPAESRIPALVAENREANLQMIELADNPLRAMPPGLPRIDGGSTVGVPFTLTWSTPLPDADNPAVSWNLVEATGHTIGADDLEGNTASRWTADGWTLVTNRSHSATHSFKGGAGDKLNNVLVSKRGYKVQPGDQLKFWTWYNMENQWDYGYVEVATDARSFVAIPGSITSNSDPNNRNIGNGITGSSNWVQATFSLAAYEGQTIWFRFRYSTDGYTYNEGWYVDDIQPVDLFTTETTVATNLPAAQYTFNTHANGTFSYLLQSNDAEGHNSAWSAPKDLQITGESDVAGDLGPVEWRGIESLGPNPVRDAVRVRFTVPSSARAGESVSLSIYDVQGRLANVVRHDAVGAGVLPGRVIESSSSVSDLSPGLYFARLEVGDRRSERKFLVIH